MPVAKCLPRSLSKIFPCLECNKMTFFHFQKEIGNFLSKIGCNLKGIARTFRYSIWHHFLWAKMVKKHFIQMPKGGEEQVISAYTPCTICMLPTLLPSHLPGQSQCPYIKCTGSWASYSPRGPLLHFLTPFTHSTLFGQSLLWTALKALLFSPLDPPLWLDTLSLCFYPFQCSAGPAYTGPSRASCPPAYL